MRWEDLTHLQTGAWEGLQFEHTSLARPGLRMEAATWTRLALRAGTAPILWARVDNYWDEWAWLLAETWPGPLLHPIRAPALRDAPAHGDERWWKYWARHFARALGDAPASPLYRGRWRLERALLRRRQEPWHSPRPPPPTGWRAVTTELGLHSESPVPPQGLVALRRPSSPEGDRVKVWRKSAGAGTLPPVLLWWWAGNLNALAVLDGHDRLLAARLEKREPDFLVLWHHEVVAMKHDAHSQASLLEGLARSRMPAEPLNSALIEAWRPDFQRAARRGWKYPGDWRTWVRDVQAECKALALVPEATGLI